MRLGALQLVKYGIYYVCIQETPLLTLGVKCLISSVNVIVNVIKWDCFSIGIATWMNEHSISLNRNICSILRQLNWMKWRKLFDKIRFRKLFEKNGVNRPNYVRKIDFPFGTKVSLDRDNHIQIDIRWKLDIFDVCY